MKAKTIIACVIGAVAIILTACLMTGLFSDDPQAPSTQEKLGYDDASLDRLVLEGASLPYLIGKYGKPVNISDRESEQLVNFLLHVPETAPPKPGRIGFTAVMRNGKMVQWMEVTIR